MYLGEAAVYNEYIATDTYNNRLTTAQKEDILDEYTFYDKTLAIIEKANLNGALITY